MSLDTFLQSNASDLSYPNIRPTLNLNFAKTKTLDPRITYTRNSIGTYVGADGYIKTAVANEPRFDHDPLTGKRLGLMVEDARTNRVPYSENISLISSNAITLTADSTVPSPTGSFNVYRITSTSATSLPCVYYDTDPSGFGTWSAFFKSGTSTTVGISFGFTFTDNGNYAIFTLTGAGSVSAIYGTGKIQQYGNGWYLCSYTYHGSMGYNRFRWGLPFGTAVGQTVYMWGLQIEVGTFGTSYIPTSGSAVTRAADSATITGTNFSQWYNSSGGTLLSIGKENSHKITSTSLTLSTDPSEKSTASNILYYPTVIQYATLKTMNAYPSIVTDGLVLNLDASKQKSYPGSGTIWTDLSGSGNNGTLVNGPTYNSANGGSLVFDGSNDYVNAGTGLALSESWTISGFVRSSVSSAVQSILFRSGDVSTGYAENYGIYIMTTGKFRCQTSADSFKYAESTIAMATNTWYYVVGLYNATTKILSIYVNGNFEGSSTALVGNPATTEAQYITLGANDGLATANRLTGNIAQASIYNRALSATEIRQNFNALRGRFGI